MGFRFVRLTAVWVLVLLSVLCQFFAIVTPIAPYTGGLAYNSAESQLSTLLKKPPTGRYSLELRTAHLPEVTMTISTIFPVTHTVGSNIIPERITRGEYYTTKTGDFHEEFRHPTKHSEPVEGKRVENEKTTFYTHRPERTLLYYQLYKTDTIEEDKVKAQITLSNMRRKDSSVRNGHSNGWSRKLRKNVELIPHEAVVIRTHACHLREGPVKASMCLSKTTNKLPIVTPSIAAQNPESPTETISDTFSDFIQDLDCKWELDQHFWKDCFTNLEDCLTVIKGITQGYTLENPKKRLVWPLSVVADELGYLGTEDGCEEGDVVPHWMHKWAMNYDFRVLWPSLVDLLDATMQQPTHDNHFYLQASSAETQLPFVSPDQAEERAIKATDMSTSKTKASDILHPGTAEAKSLKPKYHLYNVNEQVFIRASKPMQRDLPVEDHEKEEKGDLNGTTFDIPRKIHLEKRYDYQNKTSNRPDGDGSPDWPFDNDPFVWTNWTKSYSKRPDNMMNKTNSRPDGDGSSDWPFDNDPFMWTNWTKRYATQPDGLLQDPKPRLGGSKNGLKKEAEEDSVFSSYFVNFGGKNHLGVTPATLESTSRDSVETQKAPTPLPAVEELESKIQQGRIRPSMLESMLFEKKHEAETVENTSQRQQKNLEAETLQELVSVYKTQEITVVFTAMDIPVSWTTQHDPWHEGTGKKQTVEYPKPPKTGNITLTTSETMTTIISATSQAIPQIPGPAIAYFVIIIAVALWLAMGAGFCLGRGLSQKAEVVHPYGSTEPLELTGTEGNGCGLLASDSPQSRDGYTRYENKERIPQGVSLGMVRDDEFTRASASALSSPERWDWSGTTTASSDQTYVTTLGPPLVRMGLRSQPEKKPRWWKFGRCATEDIEMGAGIPDAADITASPPTAAGPTQGIPMADILPATDAEFPLYELSSTPRPVALPSTLHETPRISRSATLGTRALNGKGRRIPERAEEYESGGSPVPVE
ncbi:hypothetical protein BGX38DRAFT_1268075 [Terfezia claveryi]|nr:hypothetical protein BGX38DRAFT_1268075 [Terfezia claveryi]